MPLFATCTVCLRRCNRPLCTSTAPRAAEFIAAAKQVPTALIHNYTSHQERVAYINMIIAPWQSQTRIFALWAANIEWFRGEDGLLASRIPPASSRRRKSVNFGDIQEVITLNQYFCKVNCPFLSKSFIVLLLQDEIASLSIPEDPE